MKNKNNKKRHLSSVDGHHLLYNYDVKMAGPLSRLNCFSKGNFGKYCCFSGTFDPSNPFGVFNADVPYCQYFCCEMLDPNLSYVIFPLRFFV